MHTYRWDLDRTYLETEIHSTMGLLRAAMESAPRKRTVAGAAELVRGLLENTADAQLFVLSGSPRQMRRVLLEKLQLDGVAPTRLVLKDNLRNLLRGRIGALRNQVAYKLPELLSDRSRFHDSCRETLFGDDSEVDAVIYAVYAELVAGRMTKDDLVTLLRHQRAYPDNVERAVAAYAALDHRDVVEDIFIRIDRGVPTWLFARYLGRRVHPVFSWWQAALAMHARGHLSGRSVAEVTRACGVAEPPHRAAGLAQDAVRRGIVEPEQALAAVEDTRLPELTHAVASALDRLGPWRMPMGEQLDHLGFLGALQGLWS